MASLEEVLTMLQEIAAQHDFSNSSKDFLVEELQRRLGYTLDDTILNQLDQYMTSLSRTQQAIGISQRSIRQNSSMQQHQTASATAATSESNQDFGLLESQFPSDSYGYETNCSLGLNASASSSHLVDQEIPDHVVELPPDFQDHFDRRSLLFSQVRKCS